MSIFSEEKGMEQPHNLIFDTNSQNLLISFDMKQWILFLNTPL